jgi:hypothetical protein
VEEKRHARATINYCKINYCVGVGSNGDKAANDDANLDDSGVGNTTIQRKEGAHKNQLIQCDSQYMCNIISRHVHATAAAVEKQ